MLMRAIMVCLVVSAFFLASCNYVPAKKKLLVYTQISGTNDTLDKMTREWYKQLNQSVRDRNFSRLSQYRISAGQYLSRRRSVIANLLRDDHAQNLIDSEEVFLSARAAVINDMYSSFEAYNEMTPPDVINNQLRLIASDLGNEVSGNVAIKRSLQAYARKDALNLKTKK
jgi:hypothetical protein